MKKAHSDLKALTLEQMITELEKTPAPTSELVELAVTRLQELTRRLAARGLKAFTDGAQTVAQEIEDGLGGLVVIAVPEMKDEVVREVKTREGQGDRGFAIQA